MKVAVIGGGGREHAIIKSIAKSPLAEKIYALPGNGGITEAECVPIKATDLDGILDFCLKTRPDFVIVTPDDPLVMGAVDMLEAQGFKCFGPNKAAAMIEGSKSFAKELMSKYGIPTAKYRTFEDFDSACKYVKTQPLPVVIKADGLALGKGVIIAESEKEAISALEEMMLENKFGSSGKTVVIEEYLTGPEVSVLCFTDGNAIVPMVSSMDHKRALDGDKGLNTGGMGTVAPNPYFTEEVAIRCRKEIFEPTVEAMKKENRPFKGCLYFGLMITQNGPKVIEYNCRFGDPETQVVLPLLKSDLLKIMLDVSDGKLDESNVCFADGAACCVIKASKGYPQSYEKGYKITDKTDKKKATVFYAGVAKNGNELVTSGGRVLGLTAVANDLQSAITAAYSEIDKVNFDNQFFRRDIGRKALEAKKNNG